MPSTRARTRTTTSASALAAATAAGPSTILRTKDGTAVPLQGVSAQGRLEGLIFELTVEQRYRNDTRTNLEAVFTFPLPLRAVLLGFDLEIGERKLKAHAVARQEAAEEYEQAIDTGNTAALIEHDGNGLYTVSLGNLMAGENALIRYRYAELLDAHDGHVRLNVPTVIAPRYGKPADAGLEGPAIPGVDLLTEYPFSLTLDLPSLTNALGLRSPSHEITTTVRTDGLTVRLTRNGFLDRDFILELDQAAIPEHALVAARDGDGYVALASATLGLDTAGSRPLALKVLLDCSGSMGGDSIAAAKRALLSILDRLHPTDLISLTRFGSSIDHVTDGLEPADPHSLTPLKALVRQIDADLGGTQMADALHAVLSLATPKGRQPDVILITDGEIYDVAGVVGLAAKSNHRLFAIAIGAAPNEALARSLSDTTGGACEFVGPSEDAEAAILRTFKRLRSTPRSLGPIQWPTKPNWTAPNPSAVFPGDTLHLLAGFTAQPTGAVTMTIQDAAGQGTAIHLQLATQLTDGDLLPRLAAARRVASLDEDEALALAVKYQLATQYTSFVVVAERADGEKATDLPATVAVPHMLAAGWGGSAQAAMAPARAARVVACMDFSASEAHERLRSSVPMSRGLVDEDDSAFIDIPTFLRERVQSTPTDTQSAFFDKIAREALRQSIAHAHQIDNLLPASIAELASAHGAPPNLITALNGIVTSTGNDEADVLAVFYALLAEDAAEIGLDRALRSLMRGSILGSRAHRRLRALILKEIFQ